MSSTLFKNKLFYMLLVCALFAAFFLWDYQNNELPQGELIVENSTTSENLPESEADKIQVLNIESPNIVGKTIDLEAFDLSALESEFVLINFWASWCAPCLQEMPSMLERVHAEKGDVSLVAISTDRKRENIDKFFKKVKPLTNRDLKQEHVYWIWDETQEISLKQFNTLRVPETFILQQKNGAYTIIAKVVGLVDWKILDIKKLTTD